MEYFEWGFKVIVVGMLAWTLKEVWSNQKNKIESKVDKEVCEVRHKDVNGKLDRIQDRVDAIYNHLISDKRS